MPAETVLHARDLCVKFGKSTILNQVAFDAYKNEVVALMGPNGSGKTTLLRALVGLVPVTGVVKIHNRNLEETSIRERAALLAYVPQQSALNTPLPVESVVAHGRYASQGNGVSNQEIILQAMELVDVAHLRRKSFTNLSGGEKRRVLLARALATQAPVLLLDEPSSSLDIAHALQFYELLRKFAQQGCTIVMAIHAPHDAMRFADRVVLLEQGRVASSGRASEVLSGDRLKEIYALECKIEPAPVYYTKAPQ